MSMKWNGPGALCVGKDLVLPGEDFDGAKIPEDTLKQHVEKGRAEKSTAADLLVKSKSLDWHRAVKQLQDGNFESAEEIEAFTEGDERESVLKAKAAALEALEGDEDGE